MDQEAMEAVLRDALVCRLGMVDGNGPYVVPMSFGYADGVLYFHGGPKGRKMDALRRDPRVCFEVDVDVVLKPSETACKTSIGYRSVVGFGTAFFIEDPAEKRKALAVLMGQYADGEFEFDDAQVARTTVYGVRVESMTGRQSGD
jgi:nitroimidazol reductase NimA-like FMN-containing flavoprotein (pyridoxamine 5'-phosphate oxidase superfamily)